MGKSDLFTRAFLMVWPALLLGCASVESIKDAPVSAGEERTFDIPFARMDDVVEAALKALDIENVERQLDDSGAAVFVATHGITPASWGEVIRVIVTDVSVTRSSVKVHWRSKFRDGVITSAPNWYDKVFVAIEEQLL